MLSKEDKEIVEDYKKQGYFSHVQFISREKEVCVQTLVCKEFENGEMSCVKIHEEPIMNSEAFGSLRAILEAMEDVDNSKVAGTGEVK